MREIKFRALRFNGNGWAIGSLISPNVKDNMSFIIGWNGARFVVKTETVCQFTGLKDKNAKDIYEGDILNHPNSGNFEVRFEDFGFYLFYNGFKQNGHPTDYMEVIGNIHENSELCTV